MDFLKSCTTNLHAVDGFSQIEYQIYIAPTPTPEQVESPAHPDYAHNSRPQWDDRRHSILVELRRRHVLAQHAVIQEKICVFGGFKDAEEYLHHLNFKGT